MKEQIMVDTEHLQKWLTALRDPTNRQTRRAMVSDRPEGTVGYCCLGLGCVVAGLLSLLYEPGSVQVAPLPRREFTDWLGVGVIPGTDPLDYVNVYLDIPENMAKQMRVAPGSATLSNLNDEWHLTFPQIADMIDYFGLGGVSHRG